MTWFMEWEAEWRLKWHRCGAGDQCGEDSVMHSEELYSVQGTVQRFVLLLSNIVEFLIR